MAQISNVNESPASRRFQHKISVLAGAGMFIDGFDVSVIAVALPGLKKSWDITSPLISGIIASSVVIGMFFGMMCGGMLVDKFGRRKMYMFDLVGFVVFALLAALTQNVWQLIFTRFALGIFIGADYPISSSMTAEFTAPFRRGRMIIFMSLLWQLGSFTAYLAGIALFNVGDQAWRWMLFLGAVIAAVVIVLRHSVPESPRWLRAQGRAAEAKRIEREVKREHDFTMSTADTVAQAKGRWVDLFSPQSLRATIFCSSFWFAFGVSFYGIQMYTPTILTPFTEGRPHLAFLGAALIAFLGVVGAGLGMFTVERFGRRKQILSCFALMIIALVTLALWTKPPLVPLIIMLSVTILAANLGPGVLNMVYPNEMFPTRLRGTGVGFAGSVSRIGSILGVLVFPLLVTNWGMNKATWLFAGVAIIGMIISFFLAPETKGRSIAEVDQLADNGWRDRFGNRVFYGTYDDPNARV
ncbi:MFS transporter [Trueperella sp. LYQ143]|uniref:MFS transporter n=1 Tax=Trueperella sp. LYQ143 TaxID=3391059 RepID=UPI00398321B6